MKIKEIANKLKISPRAIRFYEEKGLISPSKQENNQYRTFTEKEIWRLQTIISLREAGMAIGDIKKALEQMEHGGKDELQYYLELQRSVMFSQWLELKQVIQTTDSMIQLLKQNHSLAPDDIYQLAESSKNLRELRKNWHDKWNFDHRASSHDRLVLEDNKPFTVYKNYEEALDITVQWVFPKRGETGLDIGTGTGNLAGRFLNKGIKIAGIDQSKEMLKQCQRKFPDMETKLGNFLAIPYIDSQFDFVVTSFAFHHLTDEQKWLALREMRRVLKPYGRICITDVMLTDKGKQPPANEFIENGYPATLAHLLDWFEHNRYITRHLQINEMLHIVYAVPI